MKRPHCSGIRTCTCKHLSINYSAVLLFVIHAGMHVFVSKHGTTVVIYRIGRRINLLSAVDAIFQYGVYVCFRDTRLNCRVSTENIRVSSIFVRDTTVNNRDS